MSKMSDTIGNKHYCDYYGSNTPAGSSAGSESVKFNTKTSHLAFNCLPIDDKITAINRKVIATEKRLMKAVDNLADKLKISKDEAVKAIEENDSPAEFWSKLPIESKQPPADCSTTDEMVSHPNHYLVVDKTYEPYKVIAAWDCDFNIGSAIKYLARFKKKWNPIEDLKKAKQYIDFEIEKLENESENNEKDK